MQLRLFKQEKPVSKQPLVEARTSAILHRLQINSVRKSYHGQARAYHSSSDTQRCHATSEGQIATPSIVAEVSSLVVPSLISLICKPLPTAYQTVRVVLKETPWKLVLVTSSNIQVL